MDWNEQRLDDPPRYTVVPRSLVFVTHDAHILMLRGAADKRLWANKLNGIGGHVEPGETPLACARREVREEAGLEVRDLDLCAIVHIEGDRSAGHTQAGVVMFVYVGQALSREVRPSREGTLEWHTLEALLGDHRTEMVEDLPELLPRIFGDAREIVYGHYAPDQQGHARFRFVLA